MNGKCKFGLTGFQLKLIALLIMFADHIGVFCPDMFFLRNIGRIAFPIFAFMLSEGFQYTKNKTQYLLRLSTFALLSEIPFNIFLSFSIFDGSKQNVLFTLSFSFFALFLYEKMHERKTPLCGLFAVIGIAVLAEIFRFDYGAYGVLLAFSFCSHYFWRGRRGDGKWKGVSFLEKTDRFILPFLTLILFKQGLPWSLCSFVFLMMYGGERGRKMKYFFYIFYPLHLLLISFVFYFLS